MHLCNLWQNSERLIVQGIAINLDSKFSKKTGKK